MTHFIGGNHIQLLRNGAEYFPALEAAIANAKHEIYLQAYIYMADEVGNRIGNALKQAAERGVAVHILLDGFGSKALPKAFVQALQQAGVQVMFYRQKISPWSFKKSRLRRLHRKVVTVDGKIGFVGGINIIDDYDIPNPAPNNVPPRVDFAVQVEGALLPAISASVHKLWRRLAWAQLLRLKIPDRNIPHYAKTYSIAHNAPVNTKTGLKAAYVLRDNVLHRRDIEDAYLSAINHAKVEIIIANAYFVPGIKFRQALLAAAKRGVSVKLLLQGRMEYFLMFAAHAFYNEFLENGIAIYEYRKSFMHSKVAVIDNRWATVGSSNIDPFSLLLAREANIIVLDSAFATELKNAVIKSMQEGAYHITPQEWAHGSLLKRLISWAAYGVVRAFLGVIGYSKEQ
jgi:cardiolipin synthase A/B